MSIEHAARKRQPRGRRGYNDAHALQHDDGGVGRLRPWREQREQARRDEARRAGIGALLPKGVDEGDGKTNVRC